jgi:hypothetical protein
MPGLASERAGKCHQAVLETMPYIKTENLVRFFCESVWKRQNMFDYHIICAPLH